MILEHIESFAEKVLRDSGATGLPVHVDEIATLHQIRISRAPHRDFSGMLIRKDGVALIGVNSNEHPVRQRFTVAHELGHFFLHPEKDAFVDYRDNQKGVMRTPRERQANMFAAALLMPRRLLEKDLRRLARHGFADDDVATLAERYQVSEDAMRFRLMNLNFLAPSKRTSR